MLICEKCGAQLPDGVSFCSRCGAPVGGYDVNGDFRATRRMTQPAGYDMRPVNPRPKNNQNLLIAALIGVIAIVGGAVVFLLVRHFDKVDSQAAAVAVGEQEGPLMTEAEARAIADEEARRRALEGIRQRKKSLLAGYESVLRRNPNESYMIVDLNNNGFPELWITYRYGRNYDNLWHVYHGEKGKAREIYSTADGEIARVGNSVMVKTVDYGTIYIRKFVYNGSAVTGTLIYDSDIDRAGSVSMPSDQSYPATDFGPLRSAFHF